MGHTVATLCGSPDTKSPRNSAGGMDSSTGDELTNRRSDPTSLLGFEGHEFGRYFQMGAEIGKGAFSVVRKARMKETGEDYAVKCIRRRDLPSGGDTNDLLTGIEALRSVSHPNIVRVYQLYRDDPENIYVVEELMKGGDLFERIKRKSFYKEDEARDLCRLLLHAISYCHRKGIVHRDLKPENLLLSSDSDDRSLKIGDFGFARSLDCGPFTAPCGSYGYLAPEIIEGKPYGAAVDMWAIGVIMYTIIGGYMPFHDENDARVLLRIKSGQFKFHAEYWRGISNEAKDLIRSLLTVDTRKRITAQQAVLHPWLRSKERKLDTSLHHVQSVRGLNSRRILRGAIHSIVFQERLARGLEQEGGEESQTCKLAVERPPFY